MSGRKMSPRLSRRFPSADAGFLGIRSKECDFPVGKRKKMWYKESGERKPLADGYRQGGNLSRNPRNATKEAPYGLVSPV